LFEIALGKIKAISEVSMSVLQGLCSFNEKLYAAWKGEVGDDRLFFSCFNGTQWDAQQTVGGNSSAGPALAILENSLVASWKGENSDERVFFSELTDSSWDAQTQIPAPVASSFGPSLADFEGKLYAAWKGSENDQSIWFSSLSGSAWSAQAQIPGVESSVGPSLAVFEGKLYAAWKGSTGDQRLWFASFNGSAWSAQAQIPGVESSVGPSLAVFEGKLYAAWKGSTGDQRLWFASFNGSTWSAQAQFPSPIASSVGPSLAGFDGKLLAMWVGPNGDQQLWYASFDGANWSTQETGPGNSGQDLPQNIGLRMQYQESTNWCWIAVATSINHFYSPGSIVTQCEIMTGVMRNLNIPGGPCCPPAATLASNAALSSLLNSPYSASALYALDQPDSGMPIACNRSGGVGDALDVNNNWNNPGGNRNDSQGSVTLERVQTEIGAARPIACDIAWTGGGQHCVAIAGVLNDVLLICDPIYGETVIQYEDFPTGYQGGAVLNSVCLTQKG
jgi:hypothetical protein